MEVLLLSKHLLVLLEHWVASIVLLLLLHDIHVAEVHFFLGFLSFICRVERVFLKLRKLLSFGAK